MIAYIYGNEVYFTISTDKNNFGQFISICKHYCIVQLLFSTVILLIMEIVRYNLEDSF